MVFVAFANSTLFPSSLPSPMFTEVEGTVIGAKYPGAGSDLGNLTDPVNVVIRSERDFPIRVIEPVWWDERANGGLGAWNPGHCILLNSKANLVWFSCNRVGFYGYRVLKEAVVVDSLTEPYFR